MRHALALTEGLLLARRLPLRDGSLVTTRSMQARLRIESSERAAAETMPLGDLERRFRGAVDPAVGRGLAREIIRLRAGLTDYAIRHQLRRAHDKQSR